MNVINFRIWRIREWRMKRFPNLRQAMSKRTSGSSFPPGCNPSIEHSSMRFRRACHYALPEGNRGRNTSANYRLR